MGPVTWRRRGALTGCREALGGGDVALFAAFLTAVGAGEVASVGGVVGGVRGR